METQASERRNRNLDILLVEDNKINARVLSKQLRAKGHQVFIAEHGLEALKYLKTTRYWRGGERPGKKLDVILMDWEMPVMNGIDCTKQIREFEVQGSLTEHMPIIVTSANARPEQIEVACSAGAVSTRSFQVLQFAMLTILLRTAFCPSPSLYRKSSTKYNKWTCRLQESKLVQRGLASNRKMSTLRHSPMHRPLDFHMLFMNPNDITNV